MNNTAVKLRRLVFWTIGAALLAGAIFYAIRPVPVLVDTAMAKRGPMEVTIDEDGITRIRERYVVSTPLTGRLLRITFDVGDAVEAHDTILARMEPTDPTLLDPRAVAQAKARVRAAERKQSAAKAELAKAVAAVNFAESEMGRARRMLDQNAASEVEFAEKELEFQQKTEDARAAGFAVDIAEYELELEKAALLLTDPQSGQPSEMELAINAPIAGRILRIYQESTTVVTAGSQLMEIGDPTDLEIVADVLSRDAVRMKSGAPVRLEHWGGEQALKGRVRLVEPSGFTKLSALGVEEQRVNAIIDLVDPPQTRPTLGDNFRVDCRIVIWRASDVLQVPTSSLFRIDGQWTVFTVVNGIAKETPVEIGHNNGQQAEVLQGLSEGVTVVVHPGDAVVDGVGVAPR
ncbi:MAG: HlyD family efflux transporter periplasmic adaptor subunit [Pirellulales bacterium]|nr:HlyD family efflux transporter periplasmic adaptor subunit [Pirellulales bacterium]